MGQAFGNGPWLHGGGEVRDTRQVFRLLARVVRASITLQCEIETGVRQGIEVLLRRGRCLHNRNVTTRRGKTRLPDQLRRFGLVRQGYHVRPLSEQVSKFSTDPYKSTFRGDREAASVNLAIS